MKDLAKLIKALALNTEFNFAKDAIVLNTIILNGKDKAVVWWATGRMLLPGLPFKYQVRLMIVSSFSYIKSLLKCVCLKFYESWPDQKVFQLCVLQGHI